MVEAKFNNLNLCGKIKDMYAPIRGTKAGRGKGDRPEKDKPTPT